MRKFTTITKEQFEDFLNKNNYSFVQVQVGAAEATYDISVKEEYPLKVRIYSTISSGESRDYGADAIRILVMNTVSNNIFMKIPKVLRIGTWETNLKNKLDTAFFNIEKFYKEFPEAIYINQINAKVHEKCAKAGIKPA